jgi:serine/threonine-protein kinase
MAAIPQISAWQSGVIRRDSARLSGSGRLGTLLARIFHGASVEEQFVWQLGSYKLIDRLGEGGMGEVWRAEHRLLGRPAAVKLIRPEVIGREESQETLERRFEREARVTAALRSPHTVTIYDFGATSDGAFYYAMELLDGLDLERLVTRFGPQSPERVIHFLLQTCDSLSEAHAKGLIHRDIKPQNIFASRLGLNYDFVKVLDFGLVKTPTPLGGSHLRLTLDGTTTGTPAFMSPEMSLGNPVDARSDIYSLGCVAYRMLTGEQVFQRDTSMAVLLAHIQEDPVPPSQRTELEIPPELDRVILACLEKDPAKRPQTAQELARMLTACPLPRPWDSARAERWWNMHVPDLGAPQTEFAAA